MIKIFSKLFDEDIEIGELANFIYRVRKENNFLGDQTIELIKKELMETRDAYNFLLYYAYINDRLVGLLLLSINIPKFGFIWDWYPYVEPGPKEDLVAIELLKNCIENTGRDIDRFEVAFTIETEQDKAQYIQYSKWFESLNFHRIAEEAVMELTLDNKEFEPLAFPKNIDLKSIKDADLNDLVDCAYEVFNSSQDIIFLDLGEAQKQAMVNKIFDTSKKPIIEDASLILMESGVVIGFVVVIPDGNEAEIRSFGIRPKYRNKGLGKNLMLLSLSILIKNGFKVVLLDVTIENKPALGVYSKLGFKISSTSNLYGLTCD
jgi:ribosomal protein S18 acetylase RimI-like enzyme